MGTGWWAAALAAVAWTGALAQEPADGRAEQAAVEAESAFAAIPEPWRAYYRDAAEADLVEDRLQRCLAYPDLPGNRWPDGHADAHCRFHALEPLDVRTIEAYLAAGDAAALDRLLDEMLDRHYSAQEFGEDIDVALQALHDASAEIDLLTSRWLELAPDSAYANLARASHLRQAAWSARGGAWARETPRESFQRMERFAEQALPLYREAIRIEPRLLPAYAGLLNLGILTSRDDLQREAIAGAQAQDPGCVEMARQRMNALEPRWGGSYEEMLSFGAELSRHLPRRPQLAIHVAAPYADRGDVLVSEDAFTRETVAILEAAVRIGSNEGALRQAANVVLNLPASEGGADHWKGVAMLLQEHRFNETSAWAHRQIGWQLLRLDPQWALRHAQRAEALDPEDAFGQYLLGAGYRRTHRFEQAEQHYLAAAADAVQRRGSLVELSMMLLYGGGAEREQAAAKAKPHIDRLLDEYPDEGAAWAMRLDQSVITDAYVDLEVVREFLRHANRDDPWQAQRAEQLETELGEQGVPAERWRP